jgi:hypothetical protein
MKQRRPKGDAKALTRSGVVEKAVKDAVRAALRHHKRVGNPVAQWRNGKVVWIQPKDIPDS